MNDEIIVEVRAIKEALADESGFDIRRIAEEIRKSEAQSATEGWKHVPAPLQPLPNSAFQRVRFAQAQAGAKSQVLQPIMSSGE